MARFIPFIVIILFAFASLTAAPAVALDRQFDNVEELEKAYKQNQRRIGQKSDEIQKLKQDQINKKAEIKALGPAYLEVAKEAASAYQAWITMRDAPPANVEPVIAALEARDLEGVYYKKLRKFAQEDRKINALEDQYKDLVRAENGAWKSLHNLWKKTKELYGQVEFFSPPHLKEVTVIRENPVTHNQDVLYAKTWTGGDEFEFIKLKIENQLAAIESVEKMIKTAEKNVAYRRGLFLQAYENWSQTNLQYEQDIYAEARVRIYLEVLDLSISTKGGTSVPAVAFAFMWRGKGFLQYLASGEGAPSFDMPTLSEDYESLIKKLGSEVDGGRGRAAAYGRPQNIVDTTAYGDSFLLGMGGELLGEGKKMVYSFAAQTLREARLQKALASSNGWWALLTASRDKAFKGYTKYHGGVFKNLASLEAHLANRGLSVGEYWLKTIKNSQFQWDTFKDVGLGMALTAAKEVVNYGMTQERFTTFKRLANLEIEWFIRRNDYNSAFWFREEQKGILQSLMEELGSLYFQKTNACCLLEQTFDPNLQVATTQAANITMVSLELTFSKAMDSDMTASLAGQSKEAKPRYKEFNRRDETEKYVYELPVVNLLDDPENFEGGDLKLTIQAKSDTNQPLDEDPATSAIFRLSTGKWVGYEHPGAGDKTSTISFVKPEVSVGVSSIAPKPEEVLVEITFKSVNSFPEEAAVAIYPADKQTWRNLYKEYPHEVLEGRLDGTATVQASLEPGDYEVRLDDGFGHEAAMVELRVSYPGFTIKAKLRGEDVTSEMEVTPDK